MDHDAWTPRRILETSGGYWATCVLHTAVELDLFTRIGDGREEVGGLSRQANTEEDAMARLMDHAGIRYDRRLPDRWPAGIFTGNISQCFVQSHHG